MPLQARHQSGHVANAQESTSAAGSNCKLRHTGSTSVSVRLGCSPAAERLPSTCLGVEKHHPSKSQRSEVRSFSPTWTRETGQYPRARVPGSITMTNPTTQNKPNLSQIAAPQALRTGMKTHHTGWLKKSLKGQETRLRGREHLLLHRPESLSWPGCESSWSAGGDRDRRVSGNLLVSSLTPASGEEFVSGECSGE